MDVWLVWARTFTRVEHPVERPVRRQSHFAPGGLEDDDEPGKMEWTTQTIPVPMDALVGVYDHDPLETIEPKDKQGLRSEKRRVNTYVERNAGDGI
jgi:hypothetical protein